MRIRTALIAALPTIVLIAVPLAAHATGIPFFGPIVPDGLDGNGTTNVQKCAAGWAALIQVANNIMAFVITILILVVTPVMIAWAGFLYVFSPSNPSMRSRANSILKNTAIGIFFALAAWLIVDLLLTSLQTVTDKGAAGSVQSFTERLFSTSGDWCLKIETQTLSQVPPGTTGQYELSSSGDSITISPEEACADNGGASYDPDRGEPNEANGLVACADGTSKSTTQSLADASKITGTSCSESSFSSFGGSASAATLSCICGVESTGNPAVGSSVDKTVNGESVSWGLMQINLTGTPVSCNGTTYDCPKAFSGPYTGASSKVTITNQTLYDQCVTAMKDPACNLQAAYGLYSLRGTQPWVNASKKCS